ncbi:hypothetical protein [Streptomyces sp. NPDC050428]
MHLDPAALGVFDLEQLADSLGDLVGEHGGGDDMALLLMHREPAPRDT